MRSGLTATVLLVTTAVLQISNQAQKYEAHVLSSQKYLSTVKSTGSRTLTKSKRNKWTI